MTETTQAEDAKTVEQDPLKAGPPQVTDEEARVIARRLFGLSGSFSSLVSERDRNFLVDEGERRFVLKIHNPADGRDLVDMQTQALLHISRADPSLPVQRLRPSLEGAPQAWVEGSSGRGYFVRLLTFVEGRNVEASELSLDAIRDYGACAARMGRALRGFFHSAAGRLLLWDIKQATTTRPMLDHIEHRQKRAQVERWLYRFEEHVLPRFGQLRAQVIHNDLARENVLFDEEGRVTGIVDFGDMVHTALVCDLAIVLGSLFGDREDPFEAAGAAIRGYDSVTSLEDEEMAVLPDLVAMRAVANVAISAWRSRLYPGVAEYITGWDAASWTMLRTLDEVGRDEVERRFRESRFRSAPRARYAGADLSERRRRALGPALSGLSYDRPVHVVRAEGTWMFDDAGRRYLDAYNNVPVVGHCHPRVTEAIARQAGTLNTNTRYLHEAIVQLAERLLASMAGLDHAMFVNSGSEANDLAWRLATAFSGGRGAIVTANAYHGATTAVIDLSPQAWPAGARPEHVETVTPPDGYRGPKGESDVDRAKRHAAYVGDAKSKLEARAATFAAFFVDPAFTSDGILLPSPAYLQEVVRRTHDAGGVVVADEVQAGFGRSGTHLWSYELASITPDIVTLGKPMGNGHPIAAVLARASVVESFAEKTDFFSTFGGNPVACSAALAGLNVIEEEQLQQRAGEIGTYLRTRLKRLMDTHTLLGDVRGAGLLIGVELVRDRDSKEPATEETQAVVNRLRDLGVLVGSTGPDENVLKIRPPLVFGREEADLLVEALDSALGDA